MNDISPAVERAVDKASERASPTPLRLAHLLLALLEDDEGRPAMLFESRGLTLEPLRRGLEETLAESPPAPSVRLLYHAAREWSVEHRADPNILSDAFLFAVLKADPAIPAYLLSLGVTLPVEWQRPSGQAEAASVEWDASSASTPAASPHADISISEFPVTSDEPAADASRPAVLAAPSPPHSAIVSEARVVDANLNRARESLRVLDDYCRFVLGDRFLTERFKGLRHRLAELTARLPARLLLASRDTLADVGTTLTAAGEYQRSSAASVAEVNLKRLQESLRSVEEFGKVLDSEFARGIEPLRYEAYTLERAVVRGAQARDRLAGARLYVLLSGTGGRHDLEHLITASAAGGVDVVQLREKRLDDRTLLDRARAVRRWTREAGVLFIVNDRPDIALLAEADGVHLGQEDLSVCEARRILGPEALVGVSTHSIEQLRQAVLDGTDYLGIGPTFPSSTKHFDHFPGLEFVAAATAETSLPAFALGGIGPSTIESVTAAGARRVAVSAAITEAEDPEAMARCLRRSLEGQTDL